MRTRFEFSRRWIVVLFVVIIGLGLAAIFPPRPVLGLDSQGSTIARGAGTTIVQAGTGPSGGFTPVLTTLAFHVENTGGGVSGSLDCLALAPEAASGSKSGQFTVNIMYVVGKITGATVQDDMATLTGVSTITGLGAGPNVPFTLVVRKGGPGATVVLTVNSLPTFPFREVLVEGNFQVFSGEN